MEARSFVERDAKPLEIRLVRGHGTVQRVL
jgi:hypothetical protein